MLPSSTDLCRLALEDTLQHLAMYLHRFLEGLGGAPSRPGASLSRQPPPSIAAETDRPSCTLERQELVVKLLEPRTIQLLRSRIGRS